MKENNNEISEASFKVKLQKMLKEGTIVRVGRNKYCVAKDGFRVYSYEYSDEAKEVAKLLQEKFPYLDYTIRAYAVSGANRFL